MYCWNQNYGTNWVSQTKLRSKVVTPVTTLAVSLADFKQHIKWDSTDTSEDNSMTTYLKAATFHAESFTRRVLQAAPWQSTLPYFGNVKLDVLPIELSSVVVKYYDVNNDLQTLSAAEYTKIDNGVDDFAEIRFTGTMPQLYSAVNVYEPVVILYNAGYSALPETIKLAIMMMAATYFEGRQNELSGASSDQVDYGSLHALYPYKLI